MWRLILAMVMFLVIFRIGLTMLRMLARPVPEPPPPGEMRRVSIRYRCEVCGSEVKMTRASDELPEPPRHCMEDMEVLEPLD